MEPDLRITWKGLATDAEAEAEVRARASELTPYLPGLRRWEVIIDRPHRHQRRGALYEVSVALTPGGEESGIRSHSGEEYANDDLFVAIRDSFDALLRRLQAPAGPV